MTGKELRALRHSVKLSQSQMAKEIGCDKNTVARYERDEVGIREPIVRLVNFIVEKHKRNSGSNQK